MKILVVGDPGAGKTIVSLAIAKMLSEAGHDVTVVDNDGADVADKVAQYKSLRGSALPLRRLDLEGLSIETRLRGNRKYPLTGDEQDQQVNISAKRSRKTKRSRA
jgi:GTPase SAR1 family protein